MRRKVLKKKRKSAIVCGMWQVLETKQSLNVYDSERTSPCAAHFYIVMLNTGIQRSVK